MDLGVARAESELAANANCFRFGTNVNRSTGCNNPASLWLTIGINNARSGSRSSLTATSHYPGLAHRSAKHPVHIVLPQLRLSCRIIGRHQRTLWGREHV